MEVQNRPGSAERSREVTTRIGGCVDEADAKKKARNLYDVLRFKRVDPVEE